MHAVSNYQLGLKYYKASDFSMAFTYFTIASNMGNRDAKYYLAGMYYAGRGTSKDINKACDLLKELAISGDKDSFEKLYSFAKRGNEKALQSLVELAKTNRSDIQFAFGEIYSGKEDFDKACDWYEKSARHGNEDALQKLAELAKSNNENALQILENLPQSNRSYIQFVIGEIYSGKEDFVKACDWYKKSTRQGNKKALQKLAELAKNRSDIQFDIGEIYSGKKDIDKACDWYKKAAQKNNKEALDKLVKLAQNGNEKALQSLEAVAQNRSDIQFEIGEIYANKEDFDKACDWYEKAARQYNKEALQRLEDLAQYYSYCGGSNIQFALGEVYCARNAIEKACDWYKKAAQQNNEKALQKLKKLANTGDESALKNLERVPQSSRSDIQLALGEIYASKEDFYKACDWYEQSAWQGNEKALQKLIELAKDGDETALKSLEELAKNRSDIQFVIGEIYSGKENFDKACDWYEKSAREGNKKALQILVKLAKNDKENALQSLEELAKSNRSDIQLALGEIYASKEDFYKACDWYEQSAWQGNEEALQKLAELANRGIEKANIVYNRRMERQRRTEEQRKIHQQQENNKRLYNSNQSSPVRYGRIKGYYVNERLEVCFVDEKMEPSEYKSDSFSPTGIFAQTFRENGRFGSYPLYDSDEEIESDEFDF